MCIVYECWIWFFCHFICLWIFCNLCLIYNECMLFIYSYVKCLNIDMMVKIGSWEAFCISPSFWGFGCACSETFLPLRRLKMLMHLNYVKDFLALLWEPWSQPNANNFKHLKILLILQLLSNLYITCKKVHTTFFPK